MVSGNVHRFLHKGGVGAARMRGKGLCAGGLARRLRVKRSVLDVGDPRLGFGLRDFGGFGWSLSLGGWRSSVGGWSLSLGGWRSSLGGWRSGLGGWSSGLGGWRFRGFGRGLSFGVTGAVLGAVRISVFGAVFLLVVHLLFHPLPGLTHFLCLAKESKQRKARPRWRPTP